MTIPLADTPEEPAPRPEGFFDFVRDLEAAGAIDPDGASEGLDLSLGAAAGSPDPGRKP